ncbi:hypothetical protein [Microlunatus flavus]|uniref:Uncharacterized protein n=1 Tax=Microlunatus flavus TaxID=1036181 RepID=A0A1H9LBB4_9ACTN|nr:hypothetical protein [Microlunatus flavus]SER08684.1 hypothetical protein SAMN05421756_108241 [Microlunatus flavus]
MIVVATALRTARRPRRTPSLAALLRALGSVRISDTPPATCLDDDRSYPRH